MAMATPQAAVAATGGAIVRFGVPLLGFGAGIALGDPIVFRVIGALDRTGLLNKAIPGVKGTSLVAGAIWLLVGLMLLGREGVVMRGFGWGAVGIGVREIMKSLGVM